MTIPIRVIDIEGRHSTLSISDDDPRDEGFSHPVMLFTPNHRALDEHWHIELTIQGAKDLYNWLADWLGDGK